MNHTGSRPAQVLKPHIQIIDEQGPFSNWPKQGRGYACKGHNLMRASSVANKRRISTCAALLLQTDGGYPPSTACCPPIVGDVQRVLQGHR